jgi:signal transduction histidine kinase/CheY-like chemotaxis protein
MECVARGETWRGRLHLTRADGTRYDLDLIAVPVRDALGETTEHIITGHDVTDLVALEAQQRQSQKLEAIGQLAGGVAHDFNNLLMVILAYGAGLVADFAPDDPRQADAEAIVEAGQRAAVLTRQLLAFGRRQVVQPRVVDLGSVAQQVEKMLRRLIPENVSILIRTQPDLWQCRADPGHIEQVIVNLAVNARDAMPRGGSLIIETTNAYLDAQYSSRHAGVRPGPYVMLAMSDTGCGMDAHVLEHIFEPFFTTKGEKGTGLGLATVYGLVKQSGGDIWVYSEPGRGTTFKVYLPRHAGGDEEGLDSQDAGAPIPAGSGTILLAEDEEAIRKIVRTMLEKAGYTVLVASNGAEAVRLAKEHPGPIALMLTDAVMPQLNGHEAAAQVAGLHPETKIIYMTGYTDDSVAHNGVLRSGVPILSKPRPGQEDDGEGDKGS